MSFESVYDYMAKQFPSGSKLNWRWLLVTFVFMVIYYIYKKYSSRNLSSEKSESFWEFWFPLTVWKNKSTYVDFGMMVFYYLLFYPILWPLGRIYSERVREALHVFFGVFSDGDFIEQNLFLKLTFGLLLFLAWDFALFFNHVLHHHFKFLWSIHKVHHSAETLNIFTSFRFHPLEQFLEMFWAFTFLSIVSSVFQWVIIGEPSFFMFWNKNIFFLVPFVYANLIHHHQNISFGKLENVFISPVYHKVHHLTEQRFHNKNFGMFIAIWDKMFGLQKLPERDFGKEQIGLGDEKFEQSFIRLISKPKKKS